MRKFARVLAFAIVVLMCFVSVSCEKNTQTSPVQISSKKYNIAVISGQSATDEFDTFCSAVTSEFNNIGYNVDKFAVNDDKEYLNELLTQSLNGGYVGVVLYDLDEYVDDFVIKASKADVACVAFSKSEYKNENASVICYNQAELVEMSVDAIVNSSGANLSDGIVKIWCNSDNAANRARSDEFDKYTMAKKIKTASVIYENDFDLNSGLSRTTKIAIQDLPQDKFNYIWTVNDDMALAVCEYLKAENINNAEVVCVGMTHKNISEMYKYKTYWRASSVVGVKTSGTKCAEVLSKIIEKKPAEKFVQIPSAILYSNDLNKDTNADIIEDL